MNKQYKRRKAFIGAAIGTVASIAGGLIGGAKKRREAKRQAQIARRNRQYEMLSQEAQNLNAAMADYKNTAGEDFEAKLKRYGGRSNMKRCGGNMKRCGGKVKRCGGQTKYRNRKAWGGTSELIGGLISAAGTIGSALTDQPAIAQAGNTIGNLAQRGFTNKMIKNNEKRIQGNLEQPLQQPVSLTTNTDYREELPKKLPAMARYGARKSVYRMACGGQKRK